MSAARGLRPLPRTLRGRLLVGVLVLVTAGLVGSDVATYALLRSYFDARTERQLARTADRVDQALANRRDVRAIDQTLRLLAGNRVQALLVDGAGRLTASPPAADPGRGALLAALDPGTVARLRRRPGRSERLATSWGSFRVAYRPVARAATGTGTGAAGAVAPVAGVVVAVSLREDDETLHHLAVTTALVTAVALLALVLLALGVLAVGLRPLRRMAATAGAIAGGDRARRIEPGHPDTETGRLAVALNDAFDQQVLAEERLRRFVADVSHELRTPLTTIGGWADLYFQGGLAGDAATATAMSRIADEAAAMRSLVEELLLLADLDQQRPLAKAPVPLSTLVAEVVADARVIAPDRRVTLEDAHDPPAVVVGDADRLRQLVRNLLGNALRHTPPGTPVHVRLGADDGGGDGGSSSSSGGSPRVTLSVADAGPGVPAEARPHLFERFSQGAPVRRRGNGLGLAIARAVAEAHGGTVELRDPATGTGSEFVVTLPAADSAADSAAG